MERMEILKDFVRYCHDCKLDATKKTNRTKYINVYMNNYIKYNGINNFESIRKELENTLKYNTLTIAYLVNKQ